MRIALALIGILLLWPLCARAQPAPTPRLTQITVSEGLPSHFVLDIAQDAYGYLWIATRDGLARYDGLRFKVWHKPDGVQDNLINGVTVDVQNRVWIATQEAGLGMLDAERKQFRYFNPSTDPRIGTAAIWAVAATADGAVWFGTMDDGLYRLRADGGIDHFLPKPGDSRSVPGLTVMWLKVDAQGRLWVCADGMLARFDGTGFVRVPTQAHHGQNVDYFYVDRAGYVWMNTIAGLSVMRPDGSWTLKPKLGEGGQAPNVFWQDRRGRLWANAKTGIGLYADGRFSAIELHNRLNNMRGELMWVSGLEDSEGGLWFPTLDAGLWRVAPGWDAFSFLQHDERNPHSLGSGFITSIASAGDGGVWIGSNKGVAELFDRHGRRRRSIAMAAHVSHQGTVTAITQDRDGTIWAGMPYALLRFPAHSDRPQVWEPDSKRDPVQRDSIKELIPTADGTIWVYMQTAGLQQRDAQGRVLHDIPFNGSYGIPKGAQFGTVAQGPDGALWVATMHGMLHWMPARRAFAPIPGIDPNAVDSFVHDPARGMVWLLRGGMLRGYAWDGKRARAAVHLGEADGIPHLNFAGLVVDADGVLWASAQRGLVRIDPDAKRVRMYGVGDGLPGQTLLGAPVPLRGSRNLAINTTHTVVIYDPRKFKPSDSPPPMAIESISVSNDGVRKLLPTDRPFDLRPHDRDLQVTAHILSLRNPAEHRYRFKLQGYDTDWVDVDAGGQRTFGQLPAGEWRMWVAGKTVDGLWSKPIVLRFRVLPPWWRTGWAIAGLLVLAAGLLLLAAWEYRARLNRRHALQLMEQKRQLAEHASQAKTQFLATLGHEVRTPMTGVLGMSELLLGTALTPRQRSYAEAIRRAGEHLLRLVNDALDLARIEAGKLELQPGAFDLHDVLDHITALQAPIAEKKGLQFSDAIAPQTPRGLLGDRMRIEQILLNLLNNAIKFTERGHVTLEAEPLYPQGVRLIVGDSGPGLSEEQKSRLFRRFEQADGARTASRYGGSGLGLAICQELAAAMGGKIAVDSVPGEGTRFVVDLPLPAATPQYRRTGDAQTGEMDAALRILLVEDDPTVAEVIGDLLRKRGHRVSTAAHGLAALAETSAAAFDLGLLDLDLPGIDGLSLARQLRAQGLQFPLIAVTARADAAAEDMARQAGFDGFLRKPLTGAMLEEKIRSVLSPRPPAA